VELRNIAFGGGALDESETPISLIYIEVKLSNGALILILLAV
jgi:hypothetical protein